MRPRPIHSRSDLIAVARTHAPTRACRRAIDEDRAEVLGGFTPAEGLPRWIVRVVSRHGRTWHIAILADENSHRFRFEYPEQVGWRDWSGQTGRNHPVYDGDNPAEYAFNRMEARRDI